MKGVYVLLIELRKDSKIRIGRLGFLDFRKGYYAYVGSGMGSLEKRIERHLKQKKKKFWHIDRFLEKSEVFKVIYSEGGKECELAKGLEGKFESVRNFGSSDCRCRSHLFFSRKPFENIRSVFKEAGLNPKAWD